MSQTVGKQQRQVIIVFPEMAVVERLRIVRICAPFEQQPRERVAVGMRRLIRPVLATTKRTSERCERVAPLKEKPCIRIGASREQQSGDVEC